MNSMKSGQARSQARQVVHEAPGAEHALAGHGPGEGMALHPADARAVIGVEEEQRRVALQQRLLQAEVLHAVLVDTLGPPCRHGVEHPLAPERGGAPHGNAEPLVEARLPGTGARRLEKVA